MTKYILLYRSPPMPAEFQPSPEQMQAMMQQWAEWKGKFKDNIVDQGDGLKPDGRVLKADDSVSDGPFMEAKEVIGGFSIVQAENYEAVLEIARACPVRHMPGNHIEIREMAGF